MEVFHMITIRVTVTVMCLTALIITIVAKVKNNRHQDEAALVTMILAILNLILMAGNELF